ncbi:ATP-binding protein [uncultured Paraglaciecola sp.]|uniref:ATP-binding protein n=1 Tax=uncultured Paraglaciecola sp. TaxID=1765024 RepID=UPI00260E7EF4|nr:ATP-binding protein [uncultured Paraglaciecola sp.]
MTSIRHFLIIIILSVVCLGNFIAALQGYRDSLASIDRIEEQQLEEKAHTLSTLVSHQTNIPSHVFGDDTLFQVWQQAVLLAKSQNAPEASFYSQDAGFHLRSYNGNQWLLYRYEGQKPDIDIIVAAKHRVYSSLTEDVLIRTILPIIWVLPIIGLLVWGVVHIGLKPLRRLAAKLDSRGANDFSVLKRDRYTRELLPIISALNGLFGRLGDAFEREKRFSADAAHELRTPLSALKINLHNLSKEQKDNQTLHSLKRTADRMEHSIEQLLALHEVSMDIDDSVIEKINLREAAQDVIVEVYDQLTLKSQTIELMGTDCFIHGPLPSIAILLRNLIDNASKYTPEKGVIRVTVGSRADQATLLIEDSGPGVPEEEYERVLDRFYRVGGDHNQSNVRGSGLGLSIVSDIVRVHNANIVISRSLELGGLAVKILFPWQGEKKCEG